MHIKESISNKYLQDEILNQNNAFSQNNGGFSLEFKKHCEIQPFFHGVRNLTEHCSMKVGILIDAICSCSAFLTQTKVCIFLSLMTLLCKK
jgi:hypothetical protein